MRVWYDGNADENIAAWFVQHTNIPFGQYSCPPIPEIGEILANLTPELLPLLPIIRHGRPDLVVQADEGDLGREYGSNWELNQVLLVAEVTSENPQGRNWRQRWDKIIHSTELGIPTAYIIPEIKRHWSKKRWNQYTRTGYQMPVIAMIANANDVPLMQISWPADGNGDLLIDPSYPADAGTMVGNPPGIHRPAGAYQGEPENSGEMVPFFQACENYLQNGQDANTAFAVQLAVNAANYATYSPDHDRGASYEGFTKACYHKNPIRYRGPPPWRVARWKDTASINWATGTPTSVTNRDMTLELGPWIPNQVNHFMRIDPYTRIIQSMDYWACRHPNTGVVDRNIVVLWGYEEGIDQWTQEVQGFMTVHDENAQCPFHQNWIGNLQATRDHLENIEQNRCPFMLPNQRLTHWFTIPHAIRFTDGDWTSPYRR